MGHHLMAVCVVCLLCAEHLPCKQHFDINSSNPSQLLTINDTEPVTRSSLGNERLSNPELYDVIDYSLPNKRRGRTKVDEPSILDRRTDAEREEENIEKNMLRSKRHATSEIHTDLPLNDVNGIDGEVTNNAFIKRMFRQFGNEDKLTMNVLGFERMLKMLGLHSLLEDPITETENVHHTSNSNNNNNNNKNNNNNNNNTCISIVELVARMSTNNNNHNNLPSKLISNGHSSTDIDGSVAMTNSTNNNTNSSSIHSNNNTNSNSYNNSSSTNGYSSTNKTISAMSSITNRTIAINSIKENLFLNSHDLTILCPILLYKLTAPTSNERVGCIQNSLLSLNDHQDNDHDIDNSTEDRTLVWVYATLSILGISLCGLLGVVVIPLMEKEYYQHILQFFVALAVGTLAGDALLHLLPHAMMTHSQQEDPHLNMTLKGFVATLALIFFFITERALTMAAEWRKRIEKKEKPSSRVRVMRDPDTAISAGNSTSEKLCKHKYSSYPYCYDEIAMATKDDHHHHNKENGVKCPPSPVAAVNHRSYKNHHDGHSDYLDTAQNLLGQNNYTISDGYVGLQSGKDEGGQTIDTNTVSTNLDDASIESGIGKDKVKEENYTIILREHEAKHHGHSHTHGHVHSPPSTLSAVAWMVVMGDGLHNFTDGMAIGAAFSNNIAGGFSTAIAVFCHELPHELGDFAVLLKAGMSARQAVYYNLLSSVLSFLGTILGILVGDTPEASAWIFACATGMFIYIALVDMMPELTSSHKDSFAVSQLFLQALGMSVGVSIMLLIAIYEDDLKVIFTSTNSHQGHHHQHYHHHH